MDKDSLHRASALYIKVNFFAKEDIPRLLEEVPQGSTESQGSLWDTIQARIRRKCAALALYDQAGRQGQCG